MELNVKRDIVTVGAGSLYVSDTVQAVDTDKVPKTFNPVTRAAREYFKILSFN